MANKKEPIEASDLQGFKFFKRERTATLSKSGTFLVVRVGS